MPRLVRDADLTADLAGERVPTEPVPAVGEFLRARRSTVAPPPAHNLRRVPGMRREEVAVRAGVSVSYYTRIEQGAVTASVDVLDAIARALDLTGDDHEHLRDLGAIERGEAPQVARGSASAESIDPALERMLATISDAPAGVLGHDMALLGWNRRAHQVFAPHLAFDSPRTAAPNWAELLFTDPACRSLFDPWGPVAIDLVGRLRASRAKHSGAGPLAALIRRLRAASPEFDRLWQEYPVRLGPLGVVRLRHPRLGVLRFRDTVLRANDDSHQLLVVFHPADG